MKREFEYMRHVGRRARAIGVIAAVGLAAIACEPNGMPGDEDERPVSSRIDRAAARVDRAPFVVTRDVLFRIEDGRRDPVLALAGSGPARDTLRLGRDSAGGALGTPRFRRLIAAPDSSWLAWEVVGGGAWVGVIAPVEPHARTLGHWTDALPDTLLWSPAGRYLAVPLRSGAGTLALSVFDTERGEPLGLPWEAECAATRACDIADVRWVGGTLLDVEIRPGADESAVPYEVNVEDLAPATGSDDEED